MIYKDDTPFNIYCSNNIGIMKESGKFITLSENICFCEDFKKELDLDDIVYLYAFSIKCSRENCYKDEIYSISINGENDKFIFIAYDKNGIDRPGYLIESDRIKDLIIKACELYWPSSDVIEELEENSTYNVYCNCLEEKKQSYISTIVEYFNKLDIGIKETIKYKENLSRGIYSGKFMNMKDKSIVDYSNLKHIEDLSKEELLRVLRDQ